MFNIHRLKLPGHRRVGNGALFFSPGFRLRRAPRTSYQYLVRVRACGRGWNAPPSYASARVHQRKAKSAAPASDVAVATRSGILHPPYGRGNVPVARNSYMRAAGTLPLPFDQILTTNDRILWSPSKRMTDGGKLKSAIALPGQPTKKKPPPGAMPRGDGIFFETTKKRVVSDAPMASCFIFFVYFRHGKAKPHIHWQKQNMI